MLLMPSRVASLLLVAACTVVARRAGAELTAQECARWIDQLGGEVIRADIRGDQAEDTRNAIMQEIAGARRSVDESRKTSLQRMKQVERQAASLVARGQVSRMEGQRLKTLSETTRRCLEHVNAP